MEVAEKAVLGIIQGLTEFLPVSSSGHLVLARDLLRVDRSTGPVLEVALHLGTLVAIILFYRRDLAGVARGALSLASRRQGKGLSGESRLFVQIVVASVPAAIAGLALRDLLEGLFASTRGVGLCLMATALVLVASRWVRGRNEGGRFGCLAALGVGVAQAVAIMPGISRSGMTIVAALALGAARDEAARFSFLIAIPATIGAFFLEVGVHGVSQAASPVALLVATCLAGGVGYLALIWLTRWVRHGRLHWFAVYLVPLALVALLV